MNDKTNTLLKELADKLGTTTEYLWHVLVNHAHISAIYSMINIFIFTLVLIFTFWFYKKFKFELTDGDDGFSVHGSILIALCILSAICVILLTQSVRNVINGLFDPQYWALEQLKDIIK